MKHVFICKFIIRKILSRGSVYVAYDSYWLYYNIHVVFQRINIVSNATLFYIFHHIRTVKCKAS